MHDFAPFLPLVGLLLGLLCLFGAFRSGRLRRLVENLPTSKTTGVFIGLVELKGTAESAQPLVSYLAGQPCVHYHWSIEEHWSRTVTETYTDANGKMQTRTRQESGWTTVADGGEMIPFFLRDDHGVILVRPDGAKLEPAGLFDEECGPGNPLYYGKGPAGAIGSSDFRRRFVERGIRQHAMLYVVGQAHEREDMVAPEIASDRNAPMFLISTRSQEQVASGMKWGQYGWAFFGLVLTVAAVIGRDAALNIPPETGWPIWAAVAAGYLAFWALVWVWMVFNSLVDLRQRVRAAWSLVDIQLNRRHDLIPNLVEVTETYCRHEQQVQAGLAALRSELSATPPGVAGPDYAGLAGRMSAIAESYPDLKANKTFAGLQENLVDTEERIALARGYFNDIATHYNTRLEVVPERFVARLGRMKPQTLMAANEFERAAVSVDMRFPPSQLGQARPSLPAAPAASPTQNCDVR